MTKPSPVDGNVLKAILHPHPALQFNYPLPYGAIVHDGGVQFVVFSRSATAMRLVIYEMHVRGFTKDTTSGVAHPGTYLGVIDKIPYLKSLGVTAVELMPVHEYPMQSPYGHDLARPNYWGYDPLAFFAPHQGYAAS